MTEPEVGTGEQGVREKEKANKDDIPDVLYHYTNKKGHDAILDSGELNPSIKAHNPNDARYGDGQYLSDIAPGTRTPGQLSKQFLNIPYQGRKFEYYIGIKTNGLNVKKGRDGVYVVPNDSPLDLTNRITSSGKNCPDANN